jgi:hypothetical protein
MMSYGLKIEYCVWVNFKFINIKRRYRIFDFILLLEHIRSEAVYVHIFLFVITKYDFFCRSLMPKMQCVR